MVDRPPDVPGGGVAIAIAPWFSSISVGGIVKGVLVDSTGAAGVCVGGSGMGVLVASGVFVTVGAFESARVSVPGINKNNARKRRAKIKRL